MLKKGDFLPEVELKDQKGNKRSFKEFEGRPLVVYFYPKNNTPGCTAEACSFRDRYEEFKDKGAEVIGISGDSVASHQSTVEKRKLPFILLSDQNRKAEKAFGVPRNLFGLIPGRVTLMADGSGRIIHTFHSQTNVQQHINQALENIEKNIS